MKNIILKKISTREKICIIIFSFLFLLIQMIGYNCLKFDSARLSYLGTYKILLLMPIFYIIFKLLFNILLKKQKENKINYKKNFIITFILIFLAWLPIIISFYPNNFAFDASTQVRMVMYDCISKYHPVIHTLFLGGLVKLSSVIFENYSIGNFLYALLQAIFMDFVFSYLITFLKKENAPKWLTILSTLLFMFLPIHSVLAISTTKDVIFSGLVLLLVIKMYNVSNENKYLNSKKNIISIIILIILTLMFRNNMLYALIAFIIPCLLILKKQRKKLILILGFQF